MENTLFLLSGKRKCGKDFFAECLKRHYQDKITFLFAKILIFCAYFWAISEIPEKWHGNCLETNPIFWVEFILSNYNFVFFFAILQTKFVESWPNISAYKEAFFRSKRYFIFRTFVFKFIKGSAP